MKCCRIAGKTTNHCFAQNVRTVNHAGENSENETIGKVVQQALPEITSAVELITERLNHGGRLLHFGAGTEWTCGTFGRVRVSSDFRQALGNGARHYRRSRNSGG